MQIVNNIYIYIIENKYWTYPILATTVMLIGYNYSMPLVFMIKFNSTPIILGSEILSLDIEVKNYTLSSTLSLGITKMTSFILQIKVYCNHLNSVESKEFYSVYSLYDLVPTPDILINYTFILKNLMLLQNL